MSPPLQRNSGFALITALLLLIGLTLIALSAMRASIFDEKAAGNVATRSQVHSLAEAALSASEEKILQLGLVTNWGAQSGQPGLIAFRPDGASAASWKSQALWTSANSFEVPVPGAPASSYPRYVIEPLHLEVEDADSRKPPIFWDYYRVTARAIDPATGAAVIFQKTSKKPQSGNS